MGYEYGYDYGYDAGSAVATGLGAIFGFIIFIWIIGIAIGVFSIICNWKVFKKAGKKGWEAIVPVYNMIVLLEITQLPMWYIALFFVPIGNVVVLFLIYIELAKKFGQSAGFGVGLTLLNPIFMAILAFNKNYVYQGGVAMNNVQMNNQPMYNNPQPTMNDQPMYNNLQPVMNNQPVMEPQMNNNMQPENNPQPIMNEQPVQASNCSRCGAQVNPGDKFCMSCGNQL